MLFSFFGFVFVGLIGLAFAWLYYLLEHPLQTLRFLGGKLREPLCGLIMFVVVLAYLACVGFGSYAFIAWLGLVDDLLLRFCFVIAVLFLSYLANEKWELSHRLDHNLRRLLGVI